MMAKKGPDRGVVSSTAAKVRFYGQVNRAIRFASTPSRSEFQSVDNGESNSRFGLVADAQLNPNVSIRGQLELGWHGSGRTSDFEDDKGAGLSFRRSVVSMTHKDMGTLSLGHSTVAGGGSYFQSFAGTGLAFGVGGPANDGITATKGEMKDKKGNLLRKLRYGAPFGLFAHRRGRVLYRTPSLMGASVEASYNEGKEWSAGGSISGLPGVKAIGVRAGVGYRDHGASGTTTLAVSGGVQHNASGLSVNGWYARESNDPDPDKSGWMADVSWTGKMIDAGSTSLTISYGKWKFGGHGTSTRYFAAVNQSIAGAATDLYAGVSYDTGDVQHTVAHKDGNAFALNPATGMNAQRDSNDVWKGGADYDPDFADVAGHDPACGAVADVDAADASDGNQCAVSRDGVFVLIAGVRIRF